MVPIPKKGLLSRLKAAPVTLLFEASSARVEEAFLCLAKRVVIEYAKLKGEFAMFEFIDVKYRGIIDLPRLKICPGKVSALTGPSGGGKTTLLRMMNKMISPDSGKIFYGDEELSAIDAVQLRRRIGMLSQQPVVFPGKLRDNLLKGFYFQQRPYPDDATLQEYLKKVRLAKTLEDDPASFSGGERQRLALARLLLLEPEVYLLDEPSSALDETTENEVIAMVVDEARQKGRTMVMITHSMAVAQGFADEVLRLEAGRLQKGGCYEGSR